MDDVLVATGPDYVIPAALILSPPAPPDEKPDARARRLEAFARRRFPHALAGVSLADVTVLLGDEQEPAAEPDRTHARYRRLRAALALDVDWEGGAPRLPLAAAETWLHALDDFDADILLCADRVLGLGPYAPEPRVGPGWEIVAPLVGDPIDVLLKRRVTDLHVHLSGLRQVGIAWARAMSRAEGWQATPNLRELFTQAGEDWCATATTARAARERMVAALGRRPLSDDEIWRTPDPVVLVNDERDLMLAVLWRLWRTGGAEGLCPNDAACYMRARHIFNHVARQPAFAEQPGLANFDDRYFRAISHKRYREPNSRGGFRSSLTFELAELNAAARILAQDGALGEVELRIAPLPLPSDYHRFARRWQRVRDDHRRAHPAQPLPIVRFAVHLVRTRGNGTRAASEEWHRLRATIDRATATLHLALAGDPDGILVDFISRIDVAGQERDAPIEMFAPHIRLLRGDEAALATLEDAAFGKGRAFADSPAWLDLARAGRHRRLGSRLAATIHAGEDFADPLEGLFHIWAAVTGCRLRHGEAIGHALALLADLDRDPGTARWARLPLHQHWASLHWLRATIEDHDRAALHSPAGAELDTLLVAADLALLGKRTTPAAARDAFRRAYPAAPGGADLMSMSEARFVAGSAMSPVGTRTRLMPLVRRAQEQLRALLIARGIVIEANPSSNLRISGVWRMHELPTLRLLDHGDAGLRFCINTDNPGLCTSSIRNEYAVMAEGARRRDRMEAGLIESALERARAAGHDVVRLRGRD